MSVVRQADTLQPPLNPRYGNTLIVLGIARISTERQNQLSLEDQEALYREWLGQHTRHTFQLKMIAGRGSGERLDRAESLQAAAEVETSAYDLVIAEDLGRIFRRVYAQVFCEACEDVGTRLIAINDHVDTGRDDWRLHAFFATMRHEMYNDDTAKRIRRSLRARFSQGGVVQFVVYGYVKPPGAKSDDELCKDPKAKSVYEEWFRRLETGGTYSEVADWLNGQGILPGPCSRRTTWDGAMVARVTHNPILKGLRVRNRTMSRRVNKTGHRRTVKAPPQERLERHCPHLAFIEPDRYDRLIHSLRERNHKYRRRGKDGRDDRAGVPRKRTAWPGQHLRCGVCGRLYYWSGRKHLRHMACSGAQQYRCWNSLTLNGTVAAEKVAGAILARIEALPGFDESLLEMVRRKAEEVSGAQAGRRRELESRRAEVLRRIGHVADAIAGQGGSRALADKLQELEDERDGLVVTIAALDREPPSTVVLPSLVDIKRAAVEQLGPLAVASPEFGRLMHRLVPELVVHPHRLCDGGAVVLRAKLALYMAALIPGSAEELNDVLRCELVVDLFDLPQRAANRGRVVALRAQGLDQREVARRLGITQPAVQKAEALDRRMKGLGLTDPYVPVMEPPGDYGKLRRHRHPRYRFEPLGRSAA